MLSLQQPAKTPFQYLVVLKIQVTERLIDVPQQGPGKAGA